jgi:hypothetical protein
MLTYSISEGFALSLLTKRMAIAGKESAKMRRRHRIVRFLFCGVVQRFGIKPGNHE